MKILGIVFAVIIATANACHSDVRNDNQMSPILSKIEPSSCIKQQESSVESAKLGASLEALMDFLLTETTEEKKLGICTKL